MGLGFTKQESDIDLTVEEKAFVENTFKIVAEDRDYLKAEELIAAWTYLADPEFVHHVKNGFFRSEPPVIKLAQFRKQYFVVVKGSVTEKAIFIATRIFDNDLENPQGVITAKLYGFVKSTVSSYFIILNHTKSKEFDSWIKHNIPVDQTDTINYSNFVMKELTKVARLSIRQIERWLWFHPLFMQLWKDALIYLYSHMNPVVLPPVVDIQALPICNVSDQKCNLYTVLTAGKIMFINETIPAELRGEWTPIFNSKIHGESFATFVSRITDQGPTILVVEDESNHIFGGFAPASWLIGPRFSGDSTAALFTLKPRMDRFIASGHNNNFQYLNANQTTMPNGLGMGGQFDYWGLWLDGKFATGQCSVSCSTFAGYSQMSAQRVFQLRHIEVWRVGMQDSDSESDEEEYLETILTSKSTDKFMLELSGHSFHSSGMIEEKEKEHKKK